MAGDPHDRAGVPAEERDDPVGDGVVAILGVFAVVATASVGAVAAGILTQDVLGALLSLAGGVVYGVLWLFGIGGISDWRLSRRLREGALSVGLWGGPAVAVVVAMTVAAGNGLVVVVASVPAALLGALIWGAHRFLDIAQGRGARH
jgi:hypothetical protein